MIRKKTSSKIRPTFEVKTIIPPASTSTSPGSSSSLKPLVSEPLVTTPIIAPPIVADETRRVVTTPITTEIDRTLSLEIPKLSDAVIRPFVDLPDFHKDLGSFKDSIAKSKTFKTHAAKIANLEDQCPLLLMPVKVETRFDHPENPSHLKIRILPDQIWLNQHDKMITQEEYDLGKSYLNQVKEHEGDKEGLQQAWQWLVSQAGVYRSSYIVKICKMKRYRPFIKKEGAEEKVATSELLPERWLVIGTKKGQDEPVIEAVSGPVRSNLKFSSQFQDIDEESLDLTVDPEISWMFDFDEAKKAGMGLEVSLTDEAKTGIDELIVVGIRETHPQNKSKKFKPLFAAKYLDKLFESHYYTRGAGFVPQGFPTNNTDDVETKWSARKPNIEGLRLREFGEQGESFAIDDCSDLGALSVPVDVDSATASSERNINKLESALGLMRSAANKFEHAQGFEARSMEAMNQLIWRVSLGEGLEQLINHDDVKKMTDSNKDWVEDWFVKNVKGGASLPALRFGDAPYGILPVQSMASYRTTDRSKSEMLTILKRLKQHWDQSEDLALQLAEHVQGDDPGERLIEILSQQPYPEEFSLQSLDQDRKVVWLVYTLLKWALVDADKSEVASRLSNYSDAFSGMINLLKNDKNFSQITTQRFMWEWYKGVLENEKEKSGLSRSVREDLDFSIKYSESLIKLLLDHEDRSDVLREFVGSDLDFFKSRIDEDVVDTNASFCRYDDDRSDYNRDHLVEVSTDKEEEFVSVQSYMSTLINHLDSLIKGKNVTLSAPFKARPYPLFYQLVEDSILRVKSDFSKNSSRKITKLKALKSSLEDLSSYSGKQIELLLQQSLGLSGWRLDAWYSSFANDRLNQIRQKKPKGIQVGAFGWVENLKPQKLESGQNHQSQGYIHTPSLAHAKTAAILRAGWLAYKEEDDRETLALDLSSQRMRRAKWVLAAVRQGQDLGDVLGYFFERFLQENQMQHWIYPLRMSVLALSEEEFDPQSPSVDGLELIHLWENKKEILETETQNYMSDVRALSEIESIIDELNEVEDAVADAVIADGVHSLVQGNIEKASASLQSISTGDTPPPELEFLNTQRTGPSFHHRVLMLWPSGKSDQSWLKKFDQLMLSPRALFSGDIENLVSHLLGEAKDLYFEYTWEHKENGTLSDTIHKVSLGDLNSEESSLFSLSALDAISMVDLHTTLDQSLLSEWLKLFLIRTYKDKSSDSKPVILSLDESEVNNQSYLRLGQWKSLFTKSRVLNEKDLTLEGADSEAEIDKEDLFSRMEILVGSFNDFVDEVGEFISDPIQEFPPEMYDRVQEKISLYLIQSVRYNLRHSLDAIVNQELSFEESFSSLDSVHQILSKRLSQINQIEISLDLESQELLKNAKKMAKILIGDPHWVGCSIVPAEITSLHESLKRMDQENKVDTDQVYSWIEKYQYVRPEFQLLNECLLLEDMRDEGHDMEFSLGQWPNESGEGWSAFEVPQTEKKARKSILTLRPNGLSVDELCAEGINYTGFFIDEVIERVPADYEDTGLALHFDSNNTESPQSLLLAMTPEGESWSLALLLQTIRETLQWAKLRSLNGESITEFDHLLPAVFASSGTS